MTHKLYNLYALCGVIIQVMTPVNINRLKNYRDFLKNK